MKGKDLTERVYHEIKRDLMLCKLPSSELFSWQTGITAAELRREKRQGV